MAYFTTHSDARTNPILDAVGAALTSVGNAIVAISEANSKVRQAEALHALSDAELAARGLKREDIARYVFADSYWV
ncbi:MAG: DUF1127 domain-containing protein [Rhodobacteraceae bacterium]|nr:DUF1127 domain-containing protein [Paracoccaceae bacterium]